MPQCRWCGKRGFFLRVHENGLCCECNTIIVLDVRERTRCIEESMKHIERSKNMATRLSRCDVALTHLEALLQYEEKEIPTIDPVPSSLISELEKEREDIVIEGTELKVEKRLARAKAAATTKGKVGSADKALQAIGEARIELRDARSLDLLENQVRTFIYERTLDSYLESGSKAEFKGQRAKALDSYQEALFLIQTSDIDDGSRVSSLGMVLTLQPSSRRCSRTAPQKISEGVRPLVR